MARVEIEWASAEVHDGELVVPLSDAASPAWLPLESLVREANAREPDPADEQGEDPADERMAAAFRTFGGEGTIGDGDGRA